MHWIDWTVLLGIIGFIVFYGIVQLRKQISLEDYLLGSQSNSWWQTTIAVMATQASAITFISTTGQGFSDGLKFVQFYFGLPLAMIVIGKVFIPAFYKLKVFTAYEYLEQRFDLKTRLLASTIFLIQRGLAAGLTIYAPSIILSTVLDWNLQWTNIAVGLAVIVYTVSGGSKAVTVTQVQQMGLILIGMLIIFFHIYFHLPQEVGLTKIIQIASAHHQLEFIQTKFSWVDRYTVWSGVIGGFFLSLAYFGTDQSQVSRYIGAKSSEESKRGMYMNGILKIPMQFFILSCGVLLFVFYQFSSQPLHFNEQVRATVSGSAPSQWKEWSSTFDSIQLVKQQLYSQEEYDKAALLTEQQQSIKSTVKEYTQQHFPQLESNDKDYVFMEYILHHLPIGLIGLLIAVILCAAMSSTSAELNALAATSTVDYFKRLFSKHLNWNDIVVSKLLTIAWGIIAIGFSLYANLFENLIQLINIIGSLFYGTVLGIFLVAFYRKIGGGNAVFIAAIAAQLFSFYMFKFTNIGFLWYNVFATLIVLGLASLLQYINIDEMIKKSAIDTLEK